MLLLLWSLVYNNNNAGTELLFMVSFLISNGYCEEVDGKTAFLIPTMAKTLFSTSFIFSFVIVFVFVIISWIFKLNNLTKKTKKKKREQKNKKKKKISGTLIVINCQLNDKNVRSIDRSYDCLFNCSNVWI